MSSSVAAYSPRFDRSHVESLNGRRNVSVDPPASPQKSSEQTEEAAYTVSASANLQQYIAFIASARANANESRQTFAEKYDEALSEVQTELSADFQGDSSAQEGAPTPLDTATATSFVAVAEQHIAAEISAEFTSADGSSFAIELSAQVDVEVRVTAAQVQVQKSDPVALDIDGDGEISLTGVANGALFDINGDGALDRSSFVSGSDVFLAFDRDNNGRIDSGKELFGDQHGAANGYIELAKFDQDRNGVIDARDDIFHRLVGVRQLAGTSLLESVGLEALGVSSIHLSSVAITRELSGGNAVIAESSYTRTDGTAAKSADLLVTYQTVV